MRKRRKAKKTAAGDLEQLKSIERAQEAVRKRKLKKIIDSIEKSKQRVKNRFREMKSKEDVDQEFQS